MSQEDVELTRRAFAAFNRRDWEAFVTLMDEDVVTESRLVAFEGAYRGHAGLRRWWDNLFDVFPDYTVEIDGSRDLGNTVVTRFHARGHAAESATPLLDPAWHASRWRGRKCVWWRICSTEAEALEAVGPSE